MHFPDLALCSYGRGAVSPEAWNVPLLAVGWLEDGFDFSTGEVDGQLISRVKQIQDETRDRFSMYVYRGLHGCSLCRSGKASQGIDGSYTNLFIPGNECIYMVSGGIVHYLDKHSYSPPEEFISALLSCPLPSSTEYEEALTKVNCGDRPELLLTFEELYPDLAKLKSEQDLRRTGAACSGCQSTDVS